MYRNDCKILKLFLEYNREETWDAKRKGYQSFIGNKIDFEVLYKRGHCSSELVGREYIESFCMY